MTPAADALVALWNDRDHRYTLRRYDLSRDAIEGVRDWRMREANEIGNADSAVLYVMALRWAPPERPGR